MEKTTQKTLQLTLWGVRGTTAPDLPSTEFGNHTSSFEIRSGEGSSLWMDLGSGASAAARQAVRHGQSLFRIFMSHYHLDHVNAAVTFQPFYNRDCRIEIHGFRDDMEDIFRNIFSAPFHSVNYDDLGSHILFHSLSASGSVTVRDAGITVSWCQVPHPQATLGYRFDDGENAVVVVPDVELGITDQISDLEALLSFPYPAGVLAVDGFFLPEEIENYHYWGHSTWQECVHLAAKTKVGKLVIIHHAPTFSDERLREIEEAASVTLGRERDRWCLTDNVASRED